MIRAIAAAMLMLLAVAAFGPGARAEHLYPATSSTPLAFTYPPVRYWYESGRVGRLHHARSARYRAHARPRLHVAARPAYRSHDIVRRVHVARRFHRAGDAYLYPATGWTPLPYEFGPWSAAVVVRR